MKTFIALIIALQLVILTGFIGYRCQLRLRAWQWLHLFLASLVAYAAGYLLLLQTRVNPFYFANLTQLVLSLLLLRVLRGYTSRYAARQWPTPAWVAIDIFALAAWAIEFLIRDGMQSAVVYFPGILANFFLIAWLSMFGDLYRIQRNNIRHNAHIALKAALPFYCLLLIMNTGVHAAHRVPGEREMMTGLLGIIAAVSGVYMIWFFVLRRRGPERSYRKSIPLYRATLINQ